jgi:hypothetical protein
MSLSMRRDTAGNRAVLSPGTLWREALGAVGVLAGGVHDVTIALIVTTIKSSPAK